MHVHMYTQGQGRAAVHSSEWGQPPFHPLRHIVDFLLMRRVRQVVVFLQLVRERARLANLLGARTRPLDLHGGIQHPVKVCHRRARRGGRESERLSLGQVARHDANSCKGRRVLQACIE
eukprot:1920871-Prymnesium_polylepis.1